MPTRAVPKRDAVGPAGVIAFEALYEAQFDFVWRSVARLGVEPAALEDAAQDVFVIAHRRLGEFEGRSSAKTWLFAIALRVAHDYRRAARRKRGHGIVGEDEGDAANVADPNAASPLEAAVRAAAVNRLHALLAQLEEPLRAIFILAELEEVSAPEIGEALGINLNTVYTRLRAARRQFNDSVAREMARDTWRER